MVSSLTLNAALSSFTDTLPLLCSEIRMFFLLSIGSMFFLLCIRDPCPVYP